MKQIKVLLERLKNPSVILSIVSQIVTILVLLNVDINKNAVMGIVTAVCSILVVLGIMSNPSTQKKNYCDDIKLCSSCNKETVHVCIGNKPVCSECGTAYEETNT